MKRQSARRRWIVLGGLSGKYASDGGVSVKVCSAGMQEIAMREGVLQCYFQPVLPYNCKTGELPSFENRISG